VGYPNPEAIATSGLDTKSTNHSASLPTSAAGEVLMLFISLYDDGIGGDAEIDSAPSGWTLVGTPGSSESHLTYIYKKESSGSEGASVSFTTTNAAFDSCICFSISGGDIDDVTASTRATGASDSPNPGNCNPGVSADYLWIAFTGFVDDGATVSSYPTDFNGDQTYKDNGGAANEHVTAAVATREYTGSSLDPGVFTLSESEGWEAWAIAVGPSGVEGVYVNIGDAGKAVTEIKVNVGDAGKAVTKMAVNIGDAGKVVFG